ncbi:MAG: histidine phosphatase family protein [Rhodospirillales bacterium]|jgi:alpha-ribazole phosphatase|nr:histidine phosphatase family protein [Rhodospirillales bacterium]
MTKNQTRFGSFSSTGDAPKITRWWWVRHAPVINGGGRLYGQEDLDCDVSETPYYDALAKHLPEDAVWVVTNLKRTTKTATAIREAGLSGPVAEEYIIEPDLAEQYFGDWQGLTWAEMEALDQSAYTEFWKDPTGNAPPGGESFAAVIERCKSPIARLIEQHAGKDIICVAHGGSIRAAIALALELGHERALSLSIDNLSLTQLDHIEGGTLNGNGKTWRVGGINMPIR